MPRLKERITGHNYPPVNKLRAYMLERKHVSGRSWKAIATEAHVDYDYLRKLVADKDPWEWPEFVRNGVCEVLDISLKRVISDGWDD